MPSAGWPTQRVASPPSAYTLYVRGALAWLLNVLLLVPIAVFPPLEERVEREQARAPEPVQLP